MGTTLGLDLSITGTGIVVWDGAHVIHREKVKTPGPRQACFEARVGVIRKRVKWAVNEFEPMLTAVEGAAYGRPNQAFALGELAGVVKFFLHVNQVAFVLVPPTTLKKYATGAGNASKDQVVEAAAPYLLVPYSNDEADALFLAKYAFTEYENLVE